jgi:hypothetical protein
LQSQLDDVEKRIGNLISSIEEGIANASVKQRLDELEAKKAEIEISLAKEKLEKTPLSKEQIVFWISRFKDGDIDDIAYQRSIVDIFVNSIFLYDDKIIITFNWKDGTKTVTLAALENATENSSIDYLDGNQIVSVLATQLESVVCNHGTVKRNQGAPVNIPDGVWNMQSSYIDDNRPLKESAAMRVCWLFFY